jgi:hypothetical protein
VSPGAPPKQKSTGKRNVVEPKIMFYSISKIVGGEY